MKTTNNVRETDLVDIENYCNELSLISGLNVGTVRFVVLTNFANVATNNVSFADATSKIVSDIYNIIENECPVVSVNGCEKKQVLVS